MRSPNVMDGLFIKQKIDVARKQCKRAAQDDVGALAEGLTDGTGAMLGFDVDGSIEQDLAALLQGQTDVEGAVGASAWSSTSGSMSRESSSATIAPRRVTE